MKIQNNTKYHLTLLCGSSIDINMSGGTSIKPYEYAEIPDVIETIQIESERQKISQCRYCTNSSDEGEGVWLDNNNWICSPCAEKVKNGK